MKNDDITLSNVLRFFVHSENIGDYRAMYEVFGNTIDPQRGKPTNGEFIALLAETARLRVRRKLWGNKGCL